MDNIFRFTGHVLLNGVIFASLKAEKTLRFDEQILTKIASTSFVLEASRNYNGLYFAGSLIAGWC